MDFPDSTQSVHNLKEIKADSIILSLLSFPDSSSASICCSFDRVLDKALASVSTDDSVKDRLVDRTIHLASLLLDSTKRCFRKRASVHNSNSWFLPPELTVKVFSMLDTMSLMQVAACCTMFNKCAMDRLCYSHIDMTTCAKCANDEVVSAMIHRAGKELRSLKLGRVVRPASDSTVSLLSGSCLSPLSCNHGFLGSRLRSLRLYNLKQGSLKVLCNVLSVCSNITDLRIVGLFGQFEPLFKSLAVNCRLLVNVFLEACASQGTLDNKKGDAFVEFVHSCPNLTYLTLIRFGLFSVMTRNFLEGCRKVKYLNLSRSHIYNNGLFLRNLTLSCKDGPLETLILRNCHSLFEKEVLEFCNSLLTGDFKSIRHIELSNNKERTCKTEFPLEKLKEERPGVTIMVDFTYTRSEKLDLVYDDVEEEELRLIEMMEDGKEDNEDDEEDDSDYEDEDEDVYGEAILL